MLKKYALDFKDILKSQIPLHSVVDALGIPCYQTGSSVLAICPFHEDQAPSMMLNYDENYFHCFACGAGTRHHSHVRSGDIISLVLNHLKLSFPETLTWLSSTFSIEPVYQNLTPEEEHKSNWRDWWHSKTTQATNRFHERLMNKDNQKTFDYLLMRGIEAIDMNYWQLGVGDSQDVEFLNTKDKICFPIRDFNGKTVSFVARPALSKEELFHLNEKERLDNKRPTPKYEHRWSLKEDNYEDQSIYKNHPSKTFKRNNYLYGLYEAKSSIRKFKSAIIVEGFTDVIALHRYNITNAVSTMGLNISDEQVNLLKRVGAKSVTLIRDGDEAGIKTIDANVRVLQSHGIEAFVCPMPYGHDPASFSATDQFSIADNSLAVYIQNNTKLFSSWKVERVYLDKMTNILELNSQTSKLRDQQLDNVLQVIREEGDYVQKEVLTEQYASLFNISSDKMHLLIKG